MKARTPTKAGKHDSLKNKTKKPISAKSTDNLTPSNNWALICQSDDDIDLDLSGLLGMVQH